MSCTFKYRVLFALVASFPVLARAETEVVEARITSTGQQSFVVELNAAKVELLIDKKSRFWIKRGPCQALRFSVGDEVFVKISQTPKGWLIKEMSDPLTYEWLTRIRSSIMPATIVGGDAEGIKVKFPDGTNFRYDLMPSTQVFAGGQKASPRDLRLNQVIFVKSRLNSTQETSATIISDFPFQKEIKKGSKTEGVSGIVEKIDPQLKWIEVRYNEDLTEKFALDETSNLLLNGAVIRKEQLTPGAKVWLCYEKEKSGALLIVDLFGLSSSSL